MSTLWSTDRLDKSFQKRRIEGDRLKDRKDRKQIRQEDQRHYDSLEKTPRKNAREWFERPPYHTTTGKNIWEEYKCRT